MNGKSQRRTTLFAAGKLVGCFGVRGLVKLQPLSRIPERFSSLREVYTGRDAADAVRRAIESVEHKGPSIVVKFEGIDDRTAAEDLVGQYVFVDEAHRAKPARGSYFVDDIIGCELVLNDGRSVGTVTEVFALPGHDLWEIRTPSGSAMIPAVGDIIKSVDIEHRKIVVELIDGLLDAGT